MPRRSLRQWYRKSVHVGLHHPAGPYPLCYQPEPLCLVMSADRLCKLLAAASAALMCTVKSALASGFTLNHGGMHYTESTADTNIHISPWPTQGDSR